MTGGVGEPLLDPAAMLAVAAAVAQQLAAAIDAEVEAGGVHAAGPGDCTRCGEVVGLRRAAELVRAAAPTVPIVVEHALLMSGGGYHVRNPDAHVERVYPLDAWIAGQLASGATVRRRVVVVVDDWSDVRGSGDRG